MKDMTRWHAQRYSERRGNLARDMPQDLSDGRRGATRNEERNMARMLEALRKAEGKHLRLHPGPPAKLEATFVAADAVEPEEADIISFIEVGGRGEPLEASPDVLAFGPLK